MNNAERLDWGGIIARGAVAGIIGGVLIDAFLYAVYAAPNHVPVTALWQGIAATALGKSFAANPAAPWIGLLLHALVSTGWGCAFSYVAQTRPQIVRHPWLSGIVFGAVVMVIMDVVTMAATAPVDLTVRGLCLSLVAHCIFFGLPVSLYVARVSRT